MSGIQEVQKVYADPLGRNACLRTAFLLGHFLKFLDPSAKFSDAQKSAMRAALDSKSQYSSLLVSDLLGVAGADPSKTGLDFVRDLDTTDFLKKFEPMLSKYIDFALLAVLQGRWAELSLRATEFRNGLRASLIQDGILPGEVNALTDEKLIEKFSGPGAHSSCYVHLEILSALFKTQIAAHKPLTSAQSDQYEDKPSVTGAAMTGEVCHLLGGNGHFDLMTQSSEFSAALMSSYHNVSSVQAVQLVSANAASTPAHSVPPVAVPAPIPAAVDSAVRGGGHVGSPLPAVQAPAPVSRSAQFLAALGTGAGMVANAASAVWNKMPTIRGRGRSVVPAVPVAVPPQARSRSAPPAPPAPPAPLRARDIQAIKKPANTNNEFALGTKKLSEDASIQASVDTGIITTKAPVVDIDFLDSVSTKQATSAPVSKLNMDKISQADDYIAAVYQAALLKNPDASFDEVKNKIQQHQVAALLDSNGLKQAAVFYQKYKAAPMTNGMIPVVVQP